MQNENQEQNVGWQEEWEHGGHDHSDRLEHLAEKAGDLASFADGQLRKIVTKYPVAAILMTVGLGFVIGRVISRR